MLYLPLVEAMVAQADAAPGGGGIAQFAMLPLMFVVFYFLLIRPASKQRKEHQALLNELKKGDEIALQGGIYGKLLAVEDKILTVEIANNVKVRVLRDRIAGRWPDGNSNNPQQQETKSEPAKAAAGKK